MITDDGRIEVAPPDELPSNEDGTSTIEAPDDDGADGEDEGQAAARGQQGQPQRRADGKFTKPSRRERRDFSKGLEDVRGELARMPTVLEQKFQQLQSGFERQLAEIRAGFGRTAAQPQQAEAAPSPIAQQISTVEGAINSELRALRNHDHSKGEYDFTRYNQLQKQLRSLEFKQLAEESGLGRAPQQQPQIAPEAIAAQVAMRHRYDTIVSENSWLQKSDPNSKRYHDAVGAALRLLLAEGRPNTLDTDREACAMVAARLRLPGRQQPRATPAREARYRGVTDNSRGEDGEPAEISVPTDQLEGTGLSNDRIRSATFRHAQKFRRGA